MSSLYVLTHRVHLFLAYLSNPSETSFRSYLTEQSFRHHLSRLDDPSDPDHTDSEDSKSHNYRSSSSQSPSSFGSLESGSSAFHFSNRASIALRTPRHAFHSFGFFTIAAVIPNLKTNPTIHETPLVIPSARNATRASDHDFFPFKEAWFLGAFGRWWKGGFVDPTWPPRPNPDLKGDEEGWSSGILNIKALDRLETFNGKHNDELDILHTHIFLHTFARRSSFPDDYQSHSHASTIGTSKTTLSINVTSSPRLFTASAPEVCHPTSPHT
jgi:hypothetical protein